MRYRPKGAFENGNIDALEHRMLADKVVSQGDIATGEGITRARVAQVMPTVMASAATSFSSSSVAPACLATARQ